MASSESTHARDTKNSFWKKSGKTVPGSMRPVYGAQHPPMHDGVSTGPVSPKKGKNKNSFHDFQQTTDDAWDSGEDDIIHMANMRMSIKEVKSTAQKVIDNHSAQLASTAASEKQSDESKVTERLVARAHSDGTDTVQLATQATGGSAPTTPSHGPGRPSLSPAGMSSGPGVGVRLASHTGRCSPLGPIPPSEKGSAKAEKFSSILDASHVELDELRKLSWSGVPKQHRPTAWKILSGYVPPVLDRRELTLQRKRKEYFGFVKQYYSMHEQELHKDTYRQIAIDIPRMSPLISLFHQEAVQKMFERILFIWAIRHPASGYVQGINDLVTPFFVVFLTEYLDEDAELDACDIASLPEQTRDILEADCFWCFSKLLDGIQDNYTFAQPGIQVKVNALKELVSRIDSDLHHHLSRHNVEYLQFSFRWMNNLLMRELPLRCIIRIWDTCLAESDGFASFHLYVCTAFLIRFSADLKRERDFQGLMLMLQNLPTHHWNNEEVGLVLAEAYKLKYMFADAPSHLLTKT